MMKERIREIADSYFISVTLINAAVFVTGMMFRPDEKFGYEAFLSPLIYGALTVIPTMIMYSGKELPISYGYSHCGCCDLRRKFGQP